MERSECALKMGLGNIGGYDKDTEPVLQIALGYSPSKSIFTASFYGAVSIPPAAGLHLNFSRCFEVQNPSMLHIAF